MCICVCIYIYILVSSSGVGEAGLARVSQGVVNAGWVGLGWPGGLGLPILAFFLVLTGTTLQGLRSAALIIHRVRSAETGTKRK